FPPDASISMPPTLDYTEFDFLLGEEVALEPCTAHLESSLLTCMTPQCLPDPTSCWRDLADEHHKALEDALEANSQLQETLAQRQEELVTLRENNVQLKELASQARQLAAVLETLMFQQRSDGKTLPPPSLQPPTPHTVAAGVWPGGVEPEPREQAAGVDTMLREMSEKCRAALQSLGGSPEGSPMAKRPRVAPRLHGAFRGLTIDTSPSPGGGELEEDGSLRAALGEGGSIRTLAFPQGNAFIMRTAVGGYRFRWVPR
ncbi:MCIN protein, partial [Centropus bengalensis]|nr:MCIN protein [Centropus bengalensis]